MILTVILAILTGFLVGAPTSKVEIQWCTRYGPGEISGWFEVQACCGVGVIHSGGLVTSSGFGSVNNPWCSGVP